MRRERPPAKRAAENGNSDEGTELGKAGVAGVQGVRGTNARMGAPAKGRQALGEATNGTHGTDVTYAT
jgi:hypothetical protein